MGDGEILKEITDETFLELINDNTIPWFQEPNEHQHFQRKPHPDTSEQDCRITEVKEAPREKDS